MWATIHVPVMVGSRQIALAHREEQFVVFPHAGDHIRIAGNVSRPVLRVEWRLDGAAMRVDIYCAILGCVDEVADETLSILHNCGWTILGAGEQETTGPAAIDPATAALEVIQRFGGIDGDHHKTWVIDQVVRALTGDRYKQWVEDMKNGKDGPNTYGWDEGIAP